MVHACFIQCQQGPDYFTFTALVFDGNMVVPRCSQGALATTKLLLPTDFETSRSGRWKGLIHVKAKHWLADHPASSI